MVAWNLKETNQRPYISKVRTEFLVPPRKNPGSQGGASAEVHRKPGLQNHYNSPHVVKLLHKNGSVVGFQKQKINHQPTSFNIL